MSKKHPDPYEGMDPVKRHVIQEHVKIDLDGLDGRGYWHPFRHKTANGGDFDLDNVIEDLDLTNVQGVLLTRLFRAMHMAIWYNIERDQPDDECRLELVTFWDSEDYVSHIGSIDIATLLQLCISDTNQVSTTQQLAALRRLRDQAEDAITKLSKHD